MAPTFRVSGTDQRVRPGEHSPDSSGSNPPAGRTRTNRWHHWVTCCGCISSQVSARSAASVQTHDHLDAQPVVHSGLRSHRKLKSAVLTWRRAVGNIDYMQ